MESLPEVVFEVSRLDLEGAISAARALQNLPKARMYLVDFAETDWVEPFGMLFFARQLRDFADRRKPARFRAVNHRHMSYAAHMGFFQSFGLDFGNDPGEAPGNSRYVPITELSLLQIRSEAQAAIEDPRAVIESRSERLADVLTVGEQGEVRDTLSYSLREMFRNVFEHSSAESIWYAAQCWPNKGWVELSILDQGVGLRPSLARNPHLRVKSDDDALRLALLPGVSGVAFKGGPRQRRDVWMNSGYGLYMTSQLCAKGGSFTICTGERGLKLGSGGEHLFDVGFAGTAIKLEFHIPQMGELGAALSELREEGSRIAGELRKGANLTASMSSRMLSKDFPD